MFEVLSGCGLSYVTTGHDRQIGPYEHHQSRTCTAQRVNHSCVCDSAWVAILVSVVPILHGRYCERNLLPLVSNYQGQNSKLQVLCLVSLTNQRTILSLLRGCCTKRLSRPDVGNAIECSRREERRECLAKTGMNAAESEQTTSARPDAILGMREPRMARSG